MVTAPRHSLSIGRNGFLMLRNYLLIATRNLLLNPSYSLVNILGLAVGLASVILVAQFVRHEFGYDRGYPDAERIYQVLGQIEDPGSSRTSTSISGAMAPYARDHLPEVETAARMAPQDVWLRIGERTFRQALIVTEPEFFDLFGFEMLRGDQGALTAAKTVCLTESLSRKLFGEDDPVGRVITFEDDKYAGDYAVRGVVSDPPRQSTIRLDLLIFHGETGASYRWNSWRRGGVPPVKVYMKLNEGVRAAAIEEILTEQLRRNTDDYGERREHRLRPLTERYLYSWRDYGLRANSFSVVGSRSGDIRYVQMSMLVAGLILAIACVNFMNLATARSLRRAREVGMRKAIGASRRQLIAQFMGEAVVVSGIALVLALAAVQMALPFFNGLVDRELVLDWVGDAWLLPGLAFTAIVTGLVSGSYPALFLSKPDAVTVLKGSSPSTRRSGVRETLVVLQFGVAVAILIATFVVYEQMTYLQEKDLGFTREQIVVVPIFWHARNDPAYQPYGIPLKRRYSEVKRAFLDHPNVLGAACSRFYLQETTARYGLLPEDGEKTLVRTVSVDETFFDVFDIPIVAGRPFSSEYATSYERDRYTEGVTEHWIINETAAHRFGWSSEEAVGKSLKWQRSGRPPNGVVVGVVRDFHIQTLHTPIEPLTFNTDQWNMKLVHLKIRGQGLQETISHIETVWKRYLPGRPVAFEFLDEKIDTYYRSERLQSLVFRTFAGIAIFVACLGLLGLAAYTSAQRTREIGIRKVLGATEGSVVAMLSREFTKLVLIANLLGWPVAYWAMQSWLSNFAYRIDLTPWPFLVSSVATLLVAWLTVSLQSWRAARTEPTVAHRSLSRNRLQSIISVSGLALALACSLAVGFYVSEQLGHDAFHEKSDRIYRVVRGFHHPGQASSYVPGSGPAVVKEWNESYPEVEEAVRLYFREDGGLWLRSGDRSFKQSFCVADSTIYDVFSFEFIRGSAEAAVRTPNGLVLSRSTAERMFGDVDRSSRPILSTC